jgi:hypothetical protein
VLRIEREMAVKRAVPAVPGLAFTLAPHLQTINYRGRFSRFAGI